MPARTDVLELARLALGSGEGRRIDLEVPLSPLRYGGQRYEPFPSGASARLDVSRTTSGHVLRLRFSTRVAGPCTRCLEEASVAVSVDAREVDQPEGADDDLRSPYVDGGELDLRGWARDALALALPARILCAADCRGLCPVCGENLNEAGPEHRHERGLDPRWAKLRDLRLD